MKLLTRHRNLAYGIITVAVCLLGIQCLHATEPDKKPTGPVLPVQEKVYLHFDNHCYFQGDTIWYKAYTVLADDNSPEPLSRILYTELLNEQGYVLERQQLVIDKNGQADGCFAISDTAFAGYYEIRAYTKWMLNFGYDYITSWNQPKILSMGKQYDGPMMTLDSYTKKVPRADYEQLYMRKYKLDNARIEPGSDEFVYYYNEYTDLNMGCPNVDPNVMTNLYRSYNNLFSRVFPVYVRPDSAHKYMQRMMPTKFTMGDYEVWWKTPEFDMKFYPEGGTLLEDVPCRVAWEAVNQQLERLNVTAFLEEDGVVIDTLMPFHAGRGLFTFTPKHGCSYRVTYESHGEKFKFKLSEIETEGARMIVEQSDEAVFFSTIQRFAMPRKLHLTIFCRGKQVETFDMNPGRTGKWATAMSLDDLPEGVNQAVIHDDDGVVYADRLFFVNKLYESKGKIMVAGIANRPYRPLEKIRLNLLATDPKGRPLQGQTMSVAVRDAGQLDPTFATGNIMTNLLLESDIKGFVENPDYYFAADDEHHRQALDLLLMVQGWRRYEWRDVMNPEKAELSYMPEQKMIISGQAVALRESPFKKKKSKLQISCSLINTNLNADADEYYRFKGIVEADSLGRFQFAYDPFYGKMKLTLRAKFVYKLEKNKKQYDLLTHDVNIFLRKQYYFPVAVKQYSWYEKNQPDTIKNTKLTWEEFEQDIYASEWIPLVTIKSKRRPHATRQRNRPAYTVNALDFVNDIWDQGFWDISETFDGNYISLGSYEGFFRNYTLLSYHTTIHNRTDSWTESYGDGDSTDVNVEERSFRHSVKEFSVITDAPRRPAPFELYNEDRWPAGTYTYGVDRIIKKTVYTDGTQITLHGREYNFQGFTHPVEYYNPDYSHASLPEIQDYRRTLYWNPNVTTDRYGQASIEFYNNSVCTTLDVSAEGLTRYGQFLVTDE